MPSVDIFQIIKSPIESPSWVIFFYWVCLNFVPDFNTKKMEGKKIIIVQGILDKRWKDWFKGMDIFYEDNNTIISGTVQDESFLHGILNLIRDLNLKLISVNPVD